MVFEGQLFLRAARELAKETIFGFYWLVNASADIEGMNTFADRVIQFNKSLKLEVALPPGIRVMNPFAENPAALEVSSSFYRKYYSDNSERTLILGINPGRFGAGVTGVPFTDTKRMKEKCGLEINDFSTYEPSSVFVYDVIEAWGGVEDFYSCFYINSPSPLGYVSINKQGREVNFNYYDSRELAAAVRPFMIDSLRAHIDVGCRTDVAFCLGSGKNFEYLSRLNDELLLFGRLVALDHPRFIMQYKSKYKKEYIDKYLRLLGGVVGQNR